MLNQKILKELLFYSVITGEFYWLKLSANNQVKVGDVAGALTKSGYKQISVNGKLYLAHRLAWFWVTGEWPKNDIDHKNGIPNTNYWLNLRDATKSQNQYNRKINSNSKSGIKGVYWCKTNKKWKAQIQHGKKCISLGYHETLENARIERSKAEKTLHGEFTRT